jgi:hypothetical protein
MKQYRQGDPAWAKELVGSAGNRRTMGAVGCLVTSLAMARNHLNPDLPHLTPLDVLNLLKKRANLWAQSSLIVHAATPHLDLDYDHRSRCFGAHPRLHVEALSAIKKGEAAIIHVSYNADTRPSHFVVAVNVDGDKIIAVDPADGTTITFVDGKAKTNRKTKTLYTIRSVLNMKGKK